MIIIETFISCDKCSTMFGVDNRHLNGKQQRNDAKKSGWKIIKGQDICIKCFLKLKQNKF